MNTEIILELLKQREALNTRLCNEIYNDSSNIDDAQRALDNFDKIYGTLIISAATGVAAEKAKQNNEN